MAFTEVFGALESKAIDGQETPYNVIHTSRFYEVQKYLSATKHIYGPGVVLVSRKFWDQVGEYSEVAVTTTRRRRAAGRSRFGRPYFARSK